MNTIIAQDSPPSTVKPVFERKAADRILAPLEELAGRSDHLWRTPAAKNGASQPPIPRYFYLGERGGGDVFRLELNLKNRP